MVTMARMQATLDRHRVGNQTRTRSGRGLWLTWTILNCIPRTMTNHWDAVRSWVCGSVTIKSLAMLECLNHAALWLIQRNCSLNTSPISVCLFTDGERHGGPHPLHSHLGPVSLLPPQEAQWGESVLWGSGSSRAPGVLHACPLAFPSESAP